MEGHGVSQRKRAEGPSGMAGTSGEVETDYQVVKYDSRGDLVWESRFDEGRHDLGRAIDVDPEGNVYVTGISNAQGWRITTVKLTERIVSFVRGDTNADGHRNIVDGVFLLNSLFRDGVAVPCDDSSDTDDSGELDLSDAIGVLHFLSRCPWRSRRRVSASGPSSPG